MKIFSAIILLLIAMGCSDADSKTDKKTKGVGIANPASVKCHDDGYRLEIRKDDEGNEYGVCIDADGNECEEWAYFRGECKLWKSVRHR